MTELHALVKHLGLKEYYVLGQSWGGFLVQEFAVTMPVGLKAIVISNSAASFPEFVVAWYVPHPLIHCLCCSRMTDEESMAATNGGKTYLRTSKLH